MRIPLFCFFIFLQTYILAQEKTMSFNVKEQSLVTVLNQLENNFNVRFSYSDKVVTNKKLTLEVQNKTITEIINILNNYTDLQFSFVSNRNIIIRRNNNSISIDEIQVLNEIILKNYLTKGIHKQKDGSFKISPKEIDLLPGITEPDVFQSLQLLPGVISPDETATGIHVRGGTPDQNLILWDGIKIYHSGHLFGTFSAFNPYITDDIMFINKGTDAKYGDRVSSVIDINTNNDVTSKFKGGFGLNLIEVDAFFEVPIVKNKLSVLASVRRSFTDFLISNTYVKLSDKVFQNTISDTILKGDNNFFYFDYNLKVNWKLSKHNTVNFSFVNVENELETDLKDTGNRIVFTDLLETENSGINLNWKKFWSSKFSHQFNTYYSKYGLSFHQTTIFNDTTENFFEKLNMVNDFGANLNLIYKISNNQSISTGYQFSNNQIKYTLSNVEQNENETNSDQILNTHSFYTSYRYKNKKIFDINAGMRLNYYASLKELVFEPRLNIYKKISPVFSLNLTVEKKTQAVSQINETIERSLSLENQLWVISNNDQIPMIKSWQYTGGITFSKNNWNFEIDAYYKEIEGLTTLNRGFIDIDDFNFKKGESVVKGIDFYLKKQFGNYKTWTSYTLSTIKNHYEELNEDKSFPANADIPHIFYWSHEYTYKHFQFALGWRWHTGKPYSNAIGIEVDDYGDKILEYDGINAYRLPNYNRLDFSSTYNFKISKDRKINGRIGVSVLNILNEENILNRSYIINPSTEEINAIDTKSLQRVSNIVFRVNW